VATHDATTASFRVPFCAHRSYSPQFALRQRHCGRFVGKFVGSSMEASIEPREPGHRVLFGQSQAGRASAGSTHSAQTKSPCSGGDEAAYEATTAFYRLPFAQAAKIWLASRGAEISGRTFINYMNSFMILNRAFGTRPLCKIAIGEILVYRQERLENAGPTTVNHECRLLAQVLIRAGVWGETKSDHKPIRPTQNSTARPHLILLQGGKKSHG